MKKIILLILTLCMCMTMGVALTACDFGTTNPGHTHTYETVWSYDATYHWYACEKNTCTDISQKDEHHIENGVCSICGCKLSVENIDTLSCCYEVVSAPMDNGLIIIDSATDGDRNYYLVDLGYATQVPIWSGAALQYNMYQTRDPELKFSKGQQTEATVEQSISNTISKTVSSTITNNLGFSASAEFSTGPLKWKVEGSYSRSWGDTNEEQNSTTSAYSTANSIAESYSTDYSVTVGGAGYGWYRFSMLATCDIYALLETDVNNTTALHITYTICPRNDAGLTIEYSPDNTWVNTETETISITNEDLALLPEPEKLYAGNDLITELWHSETYTTTLGNAELQLENCKKVGDYKQSSIITIEIPDELKYLIVTGGLYIELTTYCNASLQYRSSETSAVAKIRASYGTDAYSEVVILTATGGGWPWTYIDPAYGDEARVEGALLQKEMQVNGSTLNVMLNWICDVEFDELENWAGGTHAVNFSCDLSSVSYRFYYVKPVK